MTNEQELELVKEISRAIDRLHDDEQRHANAALHARFVGTESRGFERQEAECRGGIEALEAISLRLHSIKHTEQRRDNNVKND